MKQTTDAIIRLRSLRKHYVMGDTQVAALKGIDLDITAGEFTALKGPSGSGKSTMLNICGLLDRANQGEVVLIGHKINGMSDKRLTLLRRQYIGFVFQSYNLLPVLSASENIEYPLLLSGVSNRDRQQRLEEIIEQVGLSAFSTHRPDHLSGGQRQRVAIARALIKQPALVIADEPTANLDTETASQMIELMHSLGKSRSTTFLIATHDDRMAARCDRILLMVLFAVTNTLSMAVVERTREIGALRAMGTQPHEIVRNFVLEALVMGSAGVLLGMLLAASVSLFFYMADFQMPPPPARSQSYPLVVYIHLPLYVLTSAGVLLLSVLAAWFVARKAAKQPVVESLSHV